VVIALAAVVDDLPADGNALGVLEAGVHPGVEVAIGGFLNAPRGPCRGVEDVVAQKSM